LEALVPISGLTFVRGEGPLDAFIRVDHGMLASGTNVSFDSADTRTTSPKLTVEGPAHAHFEVVAEASSGPLGRLDARGEAMRLFGQGAKGTMKSAMASVSSRELALENAFGDATFTAAFEDAETPSVGAWVPSSSVESGLATASGHFEGSIPDKSAHGSLDFAVEELALGGASDRMSATAQGHVEVVDVSVPKLSLSLGPSHLYLKHLVAHLGSAEVSTKTLDVLTELTASSPKQQISGRATLVGTGLKGLWKEVGMSRAASAGATVPSISLAATLSFATFELTSAPSPSPARFRSMWWRAGEKRRPTSPIPRSRSKVPRHRLRAPRPVGGGFAPSWRKRLFEGGATPRLARRFT
jgi:hypothetical protein